MIRSSAIVAFVVAASAVFAVDAIPVKHQGNGRLYDKEPGFSIVALQGWARIKNADAAFMTIKDPKSETNVFNVRSIKFNDTPLDKIAPAIKAGLAQKVKDWKFVDESNPTLDGKKCYCLVGKYPQTLNNTTVELESVQYLIPTTRGVAFVATFTTRSNVFEQNKKAFQVSAESIRVD